MSPGKQHLHVTDRGGGLQRKPQGRERDQGQTGTSATESPVEEEGAGCVTAI